MIPFPINEETSDKISDKLQKIIVYMQGNSGVVTQAEIANMFGVSDRQARNYLSLLLNDGKICAVGANKNRTYTLILSSTLPTDSSPREERENIDK